MNIKNLHHICIQTEKYNQSLDFYTNILGFEIVKETPNFHTRDFNTWLKLGSFMIELQTAKKGDNLNKWSSKNEGPTHVCFLVEDVNKAHKLLKIKAIQILKSKMVKNSTKSRMVTYLRLKHQKVLK